jgi:hypothetical protein
MRPMCTFNKILNWIAEKNALEDLTKGSGESQEPAGLVWQVSSTDHFLVAVSQDW